MSDVRCILHSCDAIKVLSEFATFFIVNENQNGRLYNIFAGALYLFMVLRSCLINMMKQHYWYILFLCDNLNNAYTLHMCTFNMILVTFS